MVEPSLQETSNEVGMKLEEIEIVLNACVGSDSYYHENEHVVVPLLEKLFNVVKAAKRYKYHIGCAPYRYDYQTKTEESLIAALEELER